MELKNLRLMRGFSKKSTGSRDLLHWAVGLQQQWRKLFVRKTWVAAYICPVSYTPVYGVCVYKTRTHQEMR